MKLLPVEAFNIAETYRTPVILLLDEVVGHLREKLVVPEAGELPLVERLRTSVREGVDYHPHLPEYCEEYSKIIARACSGQARANAA